MSYAAAIDLLNAMAPELFTQPGQPRRKFSLDQVRILLHALGDPHTRFPSVLIAGTNGKGSTAATLASILTEAGFRTGLYTSPHLERVNERIRVGRDLNRDDDFARLFFPRPRLRAGAVARGRPPAVSQLFRMSHRACVSVFCRSAHGDRRARGGHGRTSRRHQCGGSFALHRHRHLPRPHGVARFDNRRNHSRKSWHSPPRRHLVTLPQHPDASQVLGEMAAQLGVRGVSAVPCMPPIGAGPASPIPSKSWARPSNWHRRCWAPTSTATWRWPWPPLWN